jgi:hypothetical protein
VEVGRLKDAKFVMLILFGLFEDIREDDEDKEDDDDNSVFNDDDDADDLRKNCKELGSLEFPAKSSTESL